MAKQAKMTKGEIALREKFDSNQIASMETFVPLKIFDFLKSANAIFNLKVDLSSDYQHLNSFDLSFKTSVGTLKKNMPYVKISMLEIMNDFGNAEKIVRRATASSIQEYLTSTLGMKDLGGKTQLELIINSLETGIMAKAQSKTTAKTTAKTTTKPSKASAEKSQPETGNVDDLKKTSTKKQPKKTSLTPRKKQFIIIQSPDGDNFIAEGLGQFREVCKNNGISNNGLYYQFTGNAKDYKGWVAAKVQDGLEFEITDENTRSAKITKGKIEPFLKQEVAEEKTSK